MEAGRAHEGDVSIVISRNDGDARRVAHRIQPASRLTEFLRQRDIHQIASQGDVIGRMAEHVSDQPVEHARADAESAAAAS